MIFIGIDNGVTGSIGIINDNPYSYEYHKTPVKKALNYQKKATYFTRVDVEKLNSLLSSYEGNSDILLGIERPMVNPSRFLATGSALRALEATLIVIESKKIAYRYIDSKEWQKVMLPKHDKEDNLKILSLEVGKRLFPNLNLKGFTDCDGILIAEYLRRKKNG